MKVKNLSEFNNYLKDNGFNHYESIRFCESLKGKVNEEYIDLKTGNKINKINEDTTINLFAEGDNLNDLYFYTDKSLHGSIERYEDGNDSTYRFFKDIPFFEFIKDGVVFYMRRELTIFYDEDSLFNNIKEASKEDLVKSIKEMNLEDADSIIWYIDNIFNSTPDHHKLNVLIKDIRKNTLINGPIFDKNWKGYENIIFFENITEISLEDFLNKYKINKQDLNIINYIIKDLLPSKVKYYVEKYLKFLNLAKKIDEDYFYMLAKNNLSINVSSFALNVLNVYDNIDKDYALNLLKLVKYDYNFKAVVVNVNSEDIHTLKYHYNDNLKSFIDIKNFIDLFLSDFGKDIKYFPLAVHLAKYSPMLAIEILNRKDLTLKEESIIKDVFANKANYEEIEGVFFNSFYVYSIKKLISALDKHMPYSISIETIYEKTEELNNCGYNTNYIEVLDILIKNVFFEEQDDIGGKKFIPLRSLDGIGKLSSLNISINEFTFKHTPDNNLSLNDFLKNKDIRFFLNPDYKLSLSRIEEALNNKNYKDMVKGYNVVDVSLEKFYETLYKNKDIQPVSIGKNFTSYISYDNTYYYESDDNITYILPEAKAVYLTANNQIILIHQDNNIYIY